MPDLLLDRAELTLTNCSIANALDVIGNRICLLLLREAFLGTRRFDDFAERVGVSESAAAKRLAELTAANIFERRPYREEGQRERHEYRLTQKGAELRVVLSALRDWGDRWESGEPGPPLHTVHRGCDAPVHAELRCTKGHLVPRSETALALGPAPDTTYPSAGPAGGLR
ncbi:winged helix-turn-helix transcriptional regulator [Antrihabitans stalactiti]|uniref:Helix-turn-helix transcriptional regulator n=1 Tax=Antrihabitans stalactiti TaxID=2584121 RepID=A0A848KKF6_9NOCA|nr:helix-turn-helix domain-containing protein [Antrihabitans stalactiti]NMN98336.1 helix-turn-helix transcriptional regulator [Antrihabitans stalactiti]